MVLCGGCVEVMLQKAVLYMKSEETWSLLLKCYLANCSPTAAPSPPGFVDAPVAAQEQSMVGLGAHVTDFEH